jgi:hypothetical protein
MANPEVVVDFVANTTRMVKGAQAAGAEAEGFGTKLRSLGKFAAFAAGGAALGALTAAVKLGIDRFEEVQKETAQTNAVLKSTGDAAHVTAKQVADLAEAIQHKSGIDEATIHSGENLLLTFRNIRNETGKGNDIFTQATHVMADMSTALGEDMNSAALQLGKALQDPIKGVAQLHREGVDFTAGQIATIKSMVDSGHTMAAQKLILQELNKEFGGSADALGKTLPGQIAIAKAAFKDWAGSIVADVVPVIEDMIGWLKDHWPEIQAAIKNAWAAISPVLKALGADIAAVVQVIKDNWGTIGPVVNDFVQTFKDAGKLIGDVLTVLADLLRGDWAQAWHDFESVVGDVMTSLLHRVTAAVDAIKLVVTVAWNAIKSVTSLVWDGIKALVSTALHALEGLAGSVVGSIRTRIEAAWKAIQKATNAVWGGIRRTVGSVLTAMAHAVSGSAIVRSMEHVVSEIKRLMTGLANWMRNEAARMFHGALSVISDVFWVVVHGAESAVNGVKHAFGHLVGWLRGLIHDVAGIAKDVAHAIAWPINEVIKGWNGLHFHIPKITLPHITIFGHKIGGESFGGWNIGFPNLPLIPFQQGGVVDRPTLGLLGEAGREIVTPETLLREILAEQRPQVRVFIGNQELKGMIRTQVVDASTGIARSLLANGA